MWVWREVGGEAEREGMERRRGVCGGGRGGREVGQEGGKEGGRVKEEGGKGER